MKNIIELLNSKTNVDEYKITKRETTSTELFFVKDQLQMNRGKDVTHINITVYKNFEEDGVKYKGSSVTKVDPTNTIEEISKKIDTAALAASFIKNQYYDLVDPTNEDIPVITSKFNEGNIVKHISNLVSDLYSEDKQFGAFINSTEFFINKNHTTIINSKGVNVSFDSYNGEIEIITEAKGEKESIEIYEVLEFSDYDSAWIKENIKDALYKASLRTKAIPLPKLKDVPVILTGEAVQAFFGYYASKASGAMVYQGISQSKINDIVQTGDITGDKVSITVKPEIPNSPFSRYVDPDGLVMKDVELIKEGKLLTFIADKRYADYLEITPTGNMNTAVVELGSTEFSSMLQGPYLELLNFSDFQMDDITGDFGGEIRLGIYFDGEKQIPVTLGSISANIKQVEQDMVFSKESQKLNRMIGPKAIKLNNISIAGN